MSITQRWWQMRAGQESWWQCLCWHRCHDIMSGMSRDISSDLVTCACVCPPSPSCQYPLFKCPLLPPLVCLSVRSSGQQRAGWIELKSFEMINITSPHWTDPKNHHLQCAHWTRVDKNWLRSTPNLFTFRIIFVRGDEIQMTFEM